MRRNSSRSEEKTDRRRFVQLLKKCYFEEFVLLSDYLYYSLLFEREYEGLSEFFDTLARSRVDIFKGVGGMLLDFGENPQMNIQLRGRSVFGSAPWDICGEDVERAIKALVGAEKQTLSDYERVMSLSEEEGIKNQVNRYICGKRELIDKFERMLAS